MGARSKFFFGLEIQALPRVPEDVHAGLEAPLDIHELYVALQSMEGGMDEDFFNVFNESFKEVMLPGSGKRAVMTLLPKKADLQEIKNWTIGSCPKRWPID